MSVDLVKSGFAVVDLETTGLSPGGHDRILEIAVVMVDAKGGVVDEWSTLVNPCRDVGPSSVHGLRSRDLIDAPLFEDVAGELAGILSGRVLAAHNLPFDARFLMAEYSALGCPELPLTSNHGICTMRLARQYLPHAPRSLADCCVVAGLRNENAHAALADARAAAGLLAIYLGKADGSEPWLQLLEEAPFYSWPPIPVPSTRRGLLRREEVAAEMDPPASNGADGGPQPLGARRRPR